MKQKSILLLLALLFVLVPATSVQAAEDESFTVSYGKGYYFVNPLTGAFNFAVSEGYIIRNGKICEAVRGASLSRNWLPLLFGVPAFIICGFPHCVADSFYYASCSHSFIAEHGWSLLAAYLPTVAGNFIGCNIYRLVLGIPAWFTPVSDPAASSADTVSDTSVSKEETPSPAE